MTNEPGTHGTPRFTTRRGDDLAKTELTVTNGSTVTDLLSGSAYTVDNGNVTVTVPADSGGILEQ